MFSAVSPHRRLQKASAHYTLAWRDRAWSLQRIWMSQLDGCTQTAPEKQISERPYEMFTVVLNVRLGSPFPLSVA